LDSAAGPGGGASDDGGGAGPTGLDAYRPAEIARLIETAGVAKARLPLVPLLTLGLLAGAFIGLGALFHLAVLAGAEPGHGPTRLAAGLAFSLGLVLVIVGGAELFTGNALLVMARVDRLVSTGALVRNWSLVWLANLAGALGLAALAALAGFADGPLGSAATTIAERKVPLSVVELLVRGALCNILVCLAVWLSFAAREVAGKVAVIALPVAAFVALGLEHSVANMFLLPFAMLAGSGIGAEAAARNLAWVSLGNLLGGGGGVALAYWAAWRAGSLVRP
jgi:formate/nitrite transporter